MTVFNRRTTWTISRDTSSNAYISKKIKAALCKAELCAVFTYNLVARGSVLVHTWEDL